MFEQDRLICQVVVEVQIGMVDETLALVKRLIGIGRSQNYNMELAKEKLSQS